MKYDNTITEKKNLFGLKVNPEAVDAARARRSRPIVGSNRSTTIRSIFSEGVDMDAGPWSLNFDNDFLKSYRVGTRSFGLK